MTEIYHVENGQVYPVVPGEFYEDPEGWLYQCMADDDHHVMITIAWNRPSITEH